MLIQSRDHALQLDAEDPLAPMRDHFCLPDGVIYLDGNSLGALPRAVSERLQQTVSLAWGQDLIKSWNTAGWIRLPTELGDRIAPLIGAGPGEVVVADSTSVNLYKVLSAALRIAREQAPARQVILSERSNFPTDLYIAQRLAEAHGMRLVLEDGEALKAALTADVAVLMLTQVNYRTGRLHDMAEWSERAHAVGALTIWDLAHSAGALPVHLRDDGADFAVGCGYKYLNGGPGAPAFVWVHPRHVNQVRQPLSGWLGHAAPFEFSPDDRPAPGIQQFQCGTPPILSMTALACGIDTLRAAEAHGGMAAIRRKSLRLTRALAQGFMAHGAAHGLTLVSPERDEERGSQVCLAHPAHAYAMVQALIARGVVGDYRAPDVLRFGVTPLYTRYVDVWDAAEHFKQVLALRLWDDPAYQTRATVT